MKTRKVWVPCQVCFQEDVRVEFDIHPDEGPIFPRIIDRPACGHEPPEDWTLGLAEEKVIEEIHREREV